MISIGIDPGLDGGLAAISPAGAAAHPMPQAGREVNAAEVARLLRGWQSAGRVEVVVEEVHAMPGQGVVSMFTFGRAFGTILGVLAALDLPVRLVRPNRWKPVVLAGTKRDKAAACAWAARAFPAVPLVPAGGRRAHDGMAEALALAEYGRRLASCRGG